MPDPKSAPAALPPNTIHIHRILPAAWIAGGGALLLLWLTRGAGFPFPAFFIWLLGCCAITILGRNLGKSLQHHGEAMEQFRREIDAQADRFARQTARLAEEHQLTQNALTESAARNDALLQELHEAEKTVQEAGDAICVIDKDYTIRRANRFMAELFNKSQEALVGNQCFHVMRNPFCGTPRCPLHSIMDGEKRRVAESFEVPGLAAGGKRALTLTATPFTDAEGRCQGIINIMREQEGSATPQPNVLARRVHDLNNTLAAVIGHTELALLHAEPASLLKENLGKALAAAQHSQTLIAQLQSPQSDTTPKLVPLSMSAILIEVSTQLTEKLPGQITLKKRIMPGHCMILADQAQLHEAIMHLCLQAAAGMGVKGGTLELALAPLTLAQNPLPLGLPSGDYLLLRITASPPSTDGTGTVDPLPNLSTAALKMATDAFKRIDGALQQEHPPTGGTVISIYLPIQPGRQPAIPQPRKRQIVGGLEKILFVDDEEVLVSMTKQFMDELGYQFDGETSSRKALDRFKKSPEYYDLVITDLAMPELTGIQMAEAMLAIRPGLPIILYSGHSENIDKELAQKIGIRIFLLKPVAASMLAQTIRSLLDTAQAP